MSLPFARKLQTLARFCLCVATGCMIAVSLVTLLEKGPIINSPASEGNLNRPELDMVNPHVTEQMEGGGDPSQTDNMAETRMKKRRNLLLNICRGYREERTMVTDTRTRLLYSKHLNATMCYVPKAGCTFWKRVFLLAEKKREGGVFDIDHSDAHLTAMKSTLEEQRFDESYDVITKSTRVLFTREPFSRLFSVYIDKFYLSSFWMYGGTIIGFHRAHPGKKALNCGSDVTFEEFLKYVVYGSHRPPFFGPQEHWTPVSLLCRPCTFDYQFIGQQETFDEDRDFIIKSFGIESYFQGEITLADTFRHGIYEVVQKNWNHIYFGKYPCINSEGYLRRVWTALQYQGYLPLNAPFPSRFIDGGLIANLDVNLTTDIIYETSNVKNITTEEWRQRKRRAMSLVFDSIDFELKEKIRKLFESDQKLFGYEQKPDYVFGKI